MTIKTVEEAKGMLNSIIARLNSLYDSKDMFDDGSDDNNQSQNRHFVSVNNAINSIHSELAGYDFDMIPSSDCDRIWMEAWDGGTNHHLPEERYNHAIEYANRLLAVINNNH